VGGTNPAFVDATIVPVRHSMTQHGPDNWSANETWSWEHDDGIWSIVQQMLFEDMPFYFRTNKRLNDFYGDQKNYNRFVHLAQSRFGTRVINPRDSESNSRLLQRAVCIEKAIRGHYYPMLAGYDEDVVDALLPLVFPNVPANPELPHRPFDRFVSHIWLNQANPGTGKSLKKLLTVYAYMHFNNLNIAQTPLVVGRIEHGHNLDLMGERDTTGYSGDVKVWFGVYDTDKFRNVLEVTLHSDDDLHGTGRTISATSVSVVRLGSLSPFGRQIRAEFFEGRGADKYANKALELAKAKFTNWRDDLAFLGRIDHKIHKPTFNFRLEFYHLG